MNFCIVPSSGSHNAWVIEYIHTTKKYPLFCTNIAHCTHVHLRYDVRLWSYTSLQEMCTLFKLKHFIKLFIVVFVKLESQQTDVSIPLGSAQATAYQFRGTCCLSISGRLRAVLTHIRGLQSCVVTVDPHATCAYYMNSSIVHWEPSLRMQRENLTSA